MRARTAVLVGSLLLTTAACSPLHLEQTEFAVFTTTPRIAAACMQQALENPSRQVRLRQLSDSATDLAIVEGEEGIGMVRFAIRDAETVGEFSVMKEHEQAADLETRFKAGLGACQGNLRPRPSAVQPPSDTIPSIYGTTIPAINRGN